MTGFAGIANLQPRAFSPASFLVTAALALMLVEPAMAAGQGEPDWSGFSAGASLGGSFGATTGQAIVAAQPQNLRRPDPSGFMAGVNAGYNFEFANHLVLGAVVDIDALKASDTLTSIAKGFQLKVKNNWMMSLRVKAGYDFGPALIYATGGIADVQTDASLDLIPATGTPAKISTWRSGWTLGAGVDYRIFAHMSLEAEYRYTRASSLNYSVAPPAAPGGHVSFSENINLLQIGLNYQF